VTTAPTPDRHIRRGQDEYWHALSALLPRGIAWPRHPESMLQKVVRGLAGILGYCDGRAADLLETESDPRKTVELLPDWERAWGLPDLCYDAPVTVADRQLALVARMTLLGGQSREFFVNLAATIGYTISISEHRTFMVGLDRCGDNRIVGDGTGTQRNYRGTSHGFIALNDKGLPLAHGEYSETLNRLAVPENRFYWTVHVSSPQLTWFRVGDGGGQAGIDPLLRIAYARDLECLLNRWKPAHTSIIFDYSAQADSTQMRVDAEGFAAVDADGAIAVGPT
jgi:uncharacterized protein YmfQ (DUF2313 family)